jgi:hypothetical protein
MPDFRTLRGVVAHRRWLSHCDEPRRVAAGAPHRAPRRQRKYYRRTAIFPIMHTVVVARSCSHRFQISHKPSIEASANAKDVVEQRYQTWRIFNHMKPWLSELFDENQLLLGEDWWPYGVANRTTIDTFLRYHCEQGLSRRRLTCTDIFRATRMRIIGLREHRLRARSSVSGRRTGC